MYNIHILYNMCRLYKINICFKIILKDLRSLPKNELIFENDFAKKNSLLIAKEKFKKKENFPSH